MPGHREQPDKALKVTFRGGDRACVPKAASDDRN